MFSLSGVKEANARGRQNIPLPPGGYFIFYMIVYYIYAYYNLIISRLFPFMAKSIIFIFSNNYKIAEITFNLKYD